MKCQILFPQKNKKNVNQVVVLAKRVVKVMGLFPLGVWMQGTVTCLSVKRWIFNYQ